jgi:hypothetical protein
MVAVHQKQEEYNRTIVQTYKAKSFHFKKVAQLIFYDFLPIDATNFKKIEMK